LGWNKVAYWKLASYLVYNCLKFYCEHCFIQLPHIYLTGFKISLQTYNQVLQCLYCIYMHLFDIQFMSLWNCIEIMFQWYINYYYVFLFLFIFCLIYVIKLWKFNICILQLKNDQCQSCGVLYYKLMNLSHLIWYILFNGWLIYNPSLSSSVLFASGKPYIRKNKLIYHIPFVLSTHKVDYKYLFFYSDFVSNLLRSWRKQIYFIKILDGG
jgi:hypothetical protein